MIFINIAMRPVESFPLLKILNAPVAACEGDPPLSLCRMQWLLRILALRTENISRKYSMFNNRFV